MKTNLAFDTARPTNELVDIQELAEADIIKMLMKSDRVRKADLLRLCDDARRELGQYSSSSAAR